LKPLDLAIKDGFLIYLIFNSLPEEFETFEVNYNSMNGGVDSINMAKHHEKRKNFAPKPYAPKK
jgi:hypothetical protein